MKDYTFKLEEQKEFILNYEIKNNNIIINFANGTRYVVPKTMANEKTILKKMREQVTESTENEERLNKEFNRRQIKLVAYAILSIGSVSLFWLSSNHVDVLSIIPSVVTSISAVSCLAATIHQDILFKKIEAKLEDLEKNKFFLENEMTINKALTNNNVLVNTRSEVRSLANEENLNLNVIDNYSLEDFQDVIDCASIENSFEFEQFEEPIKIRKRKR